MADGDLHRLRQEPHHDAHTIACHAVHIKARYHEQVVRELRALALPNLEIAQAGQLYVF